MKVLVGLVLIFISGLPDILFQRFFFLQPFVPLDRKKRKKEALSIFSFFFYDRPTQMAIKHASKSRGYFKTRDCNE